jgi:hypothetical protein
LFEDLQTQQPGIVDIYSAQERYGLPSPGECADYAGVKTPCQVNISWAVLLICADSTKCAARSNGSCALRTRRHCRRKADRKFS